MTVGFLLRTGPYTSQNVDTCYHLAKRFLAKGHEVRMFLYEDGVFNLDKEIQSPQERNLAEMVAELAQKGAKIRGCGTCAKFRGLKMVDVIEGTKLAGIVVFSNYLKECDRFLSFGF